MKIGDLSRRTDVPTRMLRYYEQQGLLSAQRSPNGYRSYDEPAVERVHRIRSLIRSGVPTRLISPILDQQDGTVGWTPSCSLDLADELGDELRAIDERISCLELSRSTIRDYLARTGHDLPAS